MDKDGPDAQIKKWPEAQRKTWTSLNEMGCLQLEEEIYTQRLIDFIERIYEVCWLLRSFYDIKLSSKEWNIRFHQAINTILL